MRLPTTKEFIISLAEQISTLGTIRTGQSVPIESLREASRRAKWSNDLEQRTNREYCKMKDRECLI